MRRIKFLSAVVVAVSVLASGIATSADKGQPDIHQVLRDLEAKEQANVLLYKNFYYGQPRSDLLKIKGARDCSQSSGIERAVCIDKQRFAGSNGWTALFSFFNDRLHRVVLIAEKPTGAAFNLATGALLKNDFIAVLIESGNHLFDIIRMSQVGTEKDGYRYYPKSRLKPP